MEPQPGQIQSDSVQEPDAVLLTSGALTVTRTQLWINGTCFQLSNVSTMRSTRENRWRWLYALGIMLIIVGAVSAGAGYMGFQNAQQAVLQSANNPAGPRFREAEDSVPTMKVLMLAGVVAIGIGVVLFGMAWQGKWKIILSVTANSGEWASVNFNTQKSFNRAAQAISSAMSGLGRSTTVNALIYRPT